MIQNDDILNMNFYKKEKFTGSYQGMRYLIQKAQGEDESDIFRVTIWPGPYSLRRKAKSRWSAGWMSSGVRTAPNGPDGKSVSSFI